MPEGIGYGRAMKKPKTPEMVKRAARVKNALIKSVPKKKKAGPTNVGASRG